MPRTARTVLVGEPHHVVLRGNNRRRLFSYPRDYLGFLKLLLESKRRFAVDVHAFCLMPNHVHLLVTPDDAAGLSSAMQRAAQRHAQRRNRLYDSTGKLFEQRFYSKPIKSDAHLAVATAYIDLNPVRAGITSTPDKYRWSSFRVQAGLRSAAPGASELWTPSRWYRALADADEERCVNYGKWVDFCQAIERWSEVRKDPPAPSGPAPTRPSRTRAAQ
ncbi:MAG: transposase [Myxococcota bacterium]